MKKINIYVLVVLGILLVTFSSCSSSQTFMVQGVPGTVISSPTNQRIAVLDNMGQAQIKTKRKEGYYHYLQAQVPGSNIQVPFALDYKNHSRAAQRGACAFGEYTFLVASIGCSIGSIACLLAGEEGPVVSYLLGGALGSIGVGGLFHIGNTSDVINRDYDYLKSQSTNSDILR